MYVLSFKANILFTDDTEQNSKSGNNYFFSVNSIQKIYNDI